MNDRSARKADEVDTGFTIYDVPVDPNDPTCHSFVGRRVYRNDDCRKAEPVVSPRPNQQETP